MTQVLVQVNKIQKDLTSKMNRNVLHLMRNPKQVRLLMKNKKAKLQLSRRINNFNRRLRNRKHKIYHNKHQLKSKKVKRIHLKTLKINNHFLNKIKSHKELHFLTLWIKSNLLLIIININIEKHNWMNNSNKQLKGNNYLLKRVQLELQILTRQSMLIHTSLITVLSSQENSLDQLLMLEILLIQNRL